MPWIIYQDALQSEQVTNYASEQNGSVLTVYFLNYLPKNEFICLILISNEAEKPYFVINFTALTFRHFVLHTYRYHIIQCRMTCAIYRCRMFTIIPFCAKRVILLTATPDLVSCTNRQIITRYYQLQRLYFLIKSNTIFKKLLEKIKFRTSVTFSATTPSIDHLYNKQLARQKPSDIPTVF